MAEEVPFLALFLNEASNELSWAVARADVSASQKTKAEDGPESV